MKKYIKLISLLLAIAILTLTLFSCSYPPLEMIGEAALAITLEDRAARKLSTLKSYTASSEMTLSTKVSGITVNYTMSGKDKVSGAGTADAEYSSEYSYITTLSDSKGNRRTQRSFLKQGLYKGEGYINTRVNSEFMLMVKSPLTEEQYIEFLKYGTDKQGHALCGTTNAEKRADGGWSASFTDFDTATLSALAEQYGLTQFSSNMTIVDATYSFEVGADLVYESAQLTLEFSDASSSFSIRTEYSDIGSTVCSNPAITEYDEVSDMRLATRVRTDLRNYVKEKSGSFTLDIDGLNGEDVLGGIDREGTFGWTDEGKFVFRAKKVDGTYEDYADGVVTNTYGNKNNMTETEATMFISSLLNPFGFSEMCVNTYTTEGSTICFDIVLPDGFFYNATRGRYSSEDNATMTVTYKDGKLSSMIVEAKGGGGYYSKVNKIRMTITYGE